VLVCFLFSCLIRYLKMCFKIYFTGKIIKLLLLDFFFCSFNILILIFLKEKPATCTILSNI
jgi:hypothetical protein